MRDLRQLKNRFTPFKSKHEFVNLIFANTKLNELTYIHSIIVFLVIGLVFIALSIFFYV